jgi:hypothetical protein
MIKELIKVNAFRNNELPLTYDLYEVQKLTAFASFSGNNDILNWDLTDPSTWNGITWNNNGHVTEIDFSYKWLSGELDCSDFGDLTKLNVYANYITSLDLSDNDALLSLNCSYNDLSQYGLDLSDCSSLIELRCDYCGLTSLDISGSPDLAVLSCAINELTELDLTDNPSVVSLACCYNYIDIQDNTAFTNQLSGLDNYGNLYLNHSPQSVPSNATFNSSELLALKGFAEYSTNNDSLDWLTEGDLDIDKVQKNVLFEKIGNEYRIVQIELTDLEITGVLNCNNYFYLKELYCNNNELTSINLSSCVDLEVLSCEDNELTSLTLPANAATTTSALYKLNCSDNHLDINMFTDTIVANILSKDDSELIFEHQIINESVSAFSTDDYNALCSIYNQGSNSDVLSWDLTLPGEWNNVNWKYDSVTQKYRLYECYFDCLDIEGDVDLSSADFMKEYSFSGTDITTIKLPEVDIIDGAFYDCQKLEAVILSNMQSIGDIAFKYCDALRGIYIPQSVTSIGEQVFEETPNVTIAGISNSYANTYATENTIPFVAGYMFSGRIVSKENPAGNNVHLYPVSEVDVVFGNSHCISDTMGYFTVFGLLTGNNTLNITYKYGFDYQQNIAIGTSSEIRTAAFDMVSYDYFKDGYINAKDFAVFNRVKNNPSHPDYSLFDTNKDGVVDNTDWSYAVNFFV